MTDESISSGQNLNPRARGPLAGKSRLTRGGEPRPIGLARAISLRARTPYIISLIVSLCASLCAVFRRGAEMPLGSLSRERARARALSPAGNIYNTPACPRGPRPRITPSEAVALNRIMLTRAVTFLNGFLRLPRALRGDYFLALAARDVIVARYRYRFV